MNTPTTFIQNPSRGPSIQLIRKPAIFLVAVVYAFAFSSLDHTIFRDIDNYYLYIKYLDFIERVIKNNNPIFFEVGYYYLNRLLELFLSPEYIIRSIVFFNCFSFMYFALSWPRGWWKVVLMMIVFFFQPQVFALQLVTIRQGIGVSILLLTLPLSIKYAWFRMAMTMLMGAFHNSFYLVGGLIIFNEALRAIFLIRSMRVRLVFIFLLTLVINVGISVVAGMIASKQGGALEAGGRGGGGAFVLFSAILGYILLFKKIDYQDKTYKYLYQISLMGLMLYLTGYFLSPLAGRMIGTYLPFIYLLLLYRAKYSDILFVAALGLVNLYLFENAQSFLYKDLSLVYRGVWEFFMEGGFKKY